MAPEIRPTERFLQSRLPQVALTLDGVVLLTNPALCRLAGADDGGLTGVDALELCCGAEDRDRAAAALREAAAGEPGGEVLLDVRDVSGRQRHLRVVWTLMRDDVGCPWYVAVHVLDETERVRAERAVAAAEARWRARFEQSSVPQAVAALDGRLVDVNAAYCALFGRSREQLVGTPVSATAHASDPGEAEAAFRRLVAGELDCAQVERVVSRPDGTPVPIWLDLTLVRDERGQPETVTAFVQDLSRLRDVERRRRQQEDFFLALSQRASDAALVADGDGALIYVSEAVRHVLGHDPDRTVGQLGWDFVHPDDVPAAREAYADVVRQGGTRTFVLRVRDAEGRWRWVEETATNLLDTAVGGVVCNLRDVTEQVEAEQALRASEARYRTIVDTAQEGILAVDPQGRTLYANQRTLDILGVAAPALQAAPVTALLDPESAAEVELRMRDRARSGTERYEVDYPHPDGRLRRLVVAASPLPGPDGTSEGSLVLISDVTDARRAEAELRDAALRDALTGLPNRVLLRDRLEHALARESVGTAVLFLDLDQFKLVNDSRGHAAGDQLLVAVADRLRHAVRPGDTVARFGGDEFVVVCEDVDEAQAADIARSLVTQLDDPFQVDEGTLHVSASVGVATSPPASAEDLLRYADTAMYAAKGAGRRRVRLFDRALSDEAEQRYVVARELRAALAAGQLALHYQPVVALDGGRVTGVEALARWSSPVLGPVPPSRFVPVAEMTGLGPELDAFVVRTALAEVACLRERGALPASARVSVNIAARSLGEADLEELLLSATASTGTTPHQVVLEITEAAVVDDAGPAAGVLRRLRAHGFGVAVDDFGTGYSSLAYLRDLPITALKVDRSFVSGIDTDADALAIVASIVDLARAVGLEVVAEGVERPQQAALLRDLGCAAGQGWLWSRALPVQAAAGAGWAAGFASRAERRPEPPRRRPAQAVGPEHGLERLLALHAQGASLSTVAAALNAEGYRTPEGVRWHRNTVARAVAGAAYPQLARGQ